LTSLRNRLLLTLSLALIGAWSLVAWISYDRARHEAEELLDGQLALAVRLIEAQIHHEQEQQNLAAGSTLTETLENEGVGRHPYEQVLAFQVWDRAGNLLLRSDNAAVIEMPQQLGYSDTSLAGVPWRMLVSVSQQDALLIQVAHPAHSRHDIGLEVAGQVALPMLFALPVLLLLVYWSVRGALNPLAVLTREMRARSADQLEAVPTVGVVAEVRPLIDAMNRLLEKVQASIRSERQLTANAAHELRTPLAALKIHAQVAAACNEQEQRSHAIAQVLRGIVRAERLVNQMLRLARLDAGQGEVRMEPLDVLALLREVQDMQQSIAQTRDQHLSVTVATAEMSLFGDAELLLAALRNLVDNACRYSHPGGEIILGAEQTPAGPCLYVLDGGPGVAEDELAGLTQRFRRGKDVTSEGSGLGLAIVERIAALHGARLLLRNEAGAGLRASMVFARQAERSAPA